MPLLIRNGEIVNADRRFQADILCDGETITKIGPNLVAPPDAEVIDAAGKYVFPGFIDPHVHIHLPFMGTLAKDTYVTASRAALVGGTTTLIEMVCPARGDDPLEAYELWKANAAGKSACDYTFHMGITRFDGETENVVRRIVADGTASLKIFLAYKGAFGIDDAELYQTLDLAKRLGVIVTAHCENAEIVSRLQQRLLAEGKTGPEWHEPSRPVTVEAEGVHHLATFAALTGAHTYVVHTSCAEALGEAKAAQDRGLKMWVETVAPYLVLDSTYAELPGFEGAKYVMSPPLREAASRRHLGRNSLGPREHRGDRSRAVRFPRPKGNGARRFHEDSQRHPQRRASRAFAVHARRGPGPIGPEPLCGCGEYESRRNFWALSAQGNDRRRQRRRSRGVRSCVSRQHHGGRPRDERRLQRV
ncbi:MAG: amidohydrolase family protein [Pirellulales bacterium]